MTTQMGCASKVSTRRLCPAIHTDLPPALLSTKAAERLASTLDRTVTALESLLIATDHQRLQDVKCLAKILIDDLRTQSHVLRERLERFSATV